MCERRPHRRGASFFRDRETSAALHGTWRARDSHHSSTRKAGHLKTLLEILVSVFLHPIALILMIFNLLGRDDLDGGKKVLWAIIGLLWGLGPILYITVGDGSLW